MLEQSGTLPTDRLYTGQRFEAGLELYDYRARFYDPLVGSFLSPDTIVPEPGHPRGWNRLAYVYGNPVRYSDPTGHCASLSGTAWSICANTVLAVAPAVHKANEYRNDIFFPNEHTTTWDRVEASTMVGGVPVVVAGAPTLIVKGVAYFTAAGTAACADGDCGNETRALQGVIERGFGGNQELYKQFIKQLHSALPSGTRIAIRGSSLTGQSWKTGRPFDALGPGTSDLDIVLIGRQAMSQWSLNAFYIRGINTMPLSDKMPNIAPALNPIRQTLQQMVGRPVNIQAMPRWFLELRKFVHNQSYLIFPD